MRDRYAFEGMWRLGFVAVVILFMAGCAKVIADDQSALPPVSEKVLKYHTMLVARPEPGYLLDRFYNSWLDESTVDSLEAFLRKKAETSQKTTDQILLAFFYAKKGDDVAALEAFRNALEHDPGSAATWYHKALVESRTLDFDSAIADLKKAREKSPDEKLAIQIDKQLGKTYARNRQTEDAIKVWQALLTANPNDDELNEDLIELHLEEGLFKEAATLEEKLIGNTKDQYQATLRKLRLGDIYNRMGDRGKAVAAYTTALDAAGSESWLEREILSQLDQVFRREDDLAGLKRQYVDLLKKYDKRIAVRRRFAQLLVELGEADAAVAAYREILELTPGERTTREEYIGVLTKLGKQAEAIEELQALSTQHEKDAELRFQLASLLQETKQAKEAVAAVDRYMEASDGSEYAYLRAARLLERLEDRAPASAVYEKMVKKFADSSSAYDAYAAFLYSVGKKSEALELWRSLAQKGDVAQTLAVARALSTRNENESALTLLKAGIEKAKNDPLYLGQMVNISSALKKYDEAIPWATERVRRAEQPADLEAAIDQAGVIIEHADKRENEANRLEALAARGVPETCLLAELYERLGESDRADETLKPVADKGNLLAVSEQIRLFSSRRDWGAAAAATRKILELPEGRKSLHVRRLVELYQRDFQFEEGLKWIDEWKRLSPGSTMPWMTEVRMLQGLGRNEAALKVLRTAVLKFDQDEDLRVRLAEFYVENNKPADASRIYWQLYEENEDLSSKLRWAQRLAEMAQQQGTVQQLVQDFDGRVRANRQSIVPLLALSEIYRVTDDYEGRRRSLTAAAKIKPDDILLLQQIARIEEQEGDWHAAVATLERAVPLDKSNRTREQIAQLHLANGNEEVGYAMLFELAGDAKADPRTLEATADMLCAAREWERAADFLQRRINDHPTDYRLRYLLAVALEEASRTNEAQQQFLQLLSDQEELPTKKASNTPQLMPGGSYYDMIRQVIPADAFEWFQLTQFRYTAYAYRQQQSYGLVVRSVAGSGVRNSVQIPNSVDSIRPMATAHLLSIAATLEEDKLNALCKELETHGIKQAKVLSRLDPNRQDFAAVLPDILEAEPENETALAILVVQSMGMRNDALGPYCAKAFEKFRQSRPQLAFMAAVQAGVAESRTGNTDEGTSKDAKDVPANKYLDEAIKIAATFDHPNPLIVMSLTTVLGGRNVGGQDATIGDAYRQKFSRLLIQWYPEMNKISQWGTWAYYAAAQSLVKNSDPTDYVKFLDDEVARWQQGNSIGSARGAAYQMVGYNRQPQLLPTMGFPPPQLSDFPPHVLAQFFTNQDARFSPYGGQQATLDEEAARKVGPLLDKIKSPILRILFAHQLELTERIESELHTLLAAKSPVLDAYLLAAGLAAEKEKFVEAVSLLEKAQYLPMKQELRQQVDASIVAGVLALKGKANAVDKDMLDVGQKACLRLRRARLDAQKRTELVAAMEELGLKNEAEKLDKLAASSGSQRSVGPATSYAVPVSPRATDQIAKLVGEGKRDAATRLLAADVTNQVRQILANPQNASYYRQQVYRQLRQQIEAHGLADDVLKSLEPGESKTAQRLTEYGMACDVLGRPEAARAAFERAVELRPKDDLARTQLILMIGASDPQAAAQHLTKISKAGRAGLGNLLAGRIQDFQATFEERIGIARFAVEYLKLLEPADLAQAYWIDNVMSMIGHQFSGRRGGLPSLYVTKSSERRQYVNQPELISERRKVHDEMCEQMLRMPDLARLGFRHLLAATEAEGKPVDRFADLAVQILTTEAQAKPNRPVVGRTVYYTSGEYEVRFRTPEEFLARRAWKSNDWKKIDETLLPKLTGAKNRDSRERLTQLATLYRCDEKQFVDEAEKAVKQFKPNQPSQANEGLAIAVDVWAERELKVDLQPLIIKQLKIDAMGQNSYQAPGYVMRYLDSGAQKLDRERLNAFLEEVANVYLGPADKRNEFIKKNYNRNQITWGTPNGRIYVFGQLMEQLSQRSDLLFAVLTHLDQYDEPKPVQNLEYRVNAAVQELKANDADATMAILRKSPWLSDLEHFRPLTVGSRGANSPFILLLQQRNSKDAEFNRKLRELVEADQAKNGKTFGAGLVLAVLDQEKTPTALIDYVGSQLDSVRALPAKRQQDLATLVRGLVKSDVSNRKDLNGAAKAAQEWLAGGSAGQAQSMLSRVQQAKRLEELGIDNGQADNFFRQNLAELISGDGATALPVFQRVCELSREAQRRGQWHMYVGNGESLEGSLLSQSSYAVQPHDWPLFRFMVDVVNSNGKRQVEAGYSVENVARGAIQTCIGRLQSTANGKPVLIDDKIHAIYDELGAVLNGRPSSLFVRSFYDQFHSELQNQPNTDKLRDWLQKESAGGKYPNLAGDLHAALALIADERNRPGQEKTANARRAMADHYKRFLSILQDEKLSLTWRIQVAAFLSDRGPQQLPAEIVNEIASIYARALNLDVPIANKQNQLLTESVLSIVREPDSEKLVNEWRSAWQRRYLGQQARQANAPQQFENLGRLTDWSALGRALEVYVAKESPELPDEAKRLLAVYDDQIGHLPTVYAILLRSHHPEEAARLLRQHVLKLDVDWPNIEETRYDADIESLVPQLLEKLDRDDERYLAQVLFAAMPDTDRKVNTNEDAGNRPTPSDERLSKLAGKFASIPFQDVAIKKLCLVLLSGSDAAGKQVAKDIAAAYDANAVVSAAASPDRTRLKFESQLASCYFRNLLREGKHEPVVELLKRISANPNDDDYRFGETLNPFAECIAESLVDTQRTKWSDTACLALGESLGNSLKGREYINLRNFERFGTVLTALYCQVDRGKELNQLREKLSPNNRNQFEYRGVNNEIWKAGLALNGPPGPTTLDARIRFLKNVLSYAYDQKWFNGTGNRYRMRGDSDSNFLNSVVKAQLLSNEELESEGAKALDGIGPKEEPAYGKAAFANWLQSQKEYEKAAAVWRSMITVTADAKKVPRNDANYILGLATSLKNLGRFDEALKTLSMLEGKEFDESLKQSYQEYKRGIEIAKKNAETPKEDVPKSDKSSRVVPRFSPVFQTDCATWFLVPVV